MDHPGPDQLVPNLPRELEVRVVIIVDVPDLRPAGLQLAVPVAGDYGFGLCSCTMCFSSPYSSLLLRVP